MDAEIRYCPLKDFYATSLIGVWDAGIKFQYACLIFSIYSWHFQKIVCSSWWEKTPMQWEILLQEWNMNDGQFIILGRNLICSTLGSNYNDEMWREFLGKLNEGCRIHCTVRTALSMESKNSKHRVYQRAKAPFFFVGRWVPLPSIGWLDTVSFDKSLYLNTISFNLSLWGPVPSIRWLDMVSCDKSLYLNPNSFKLMQNMPKTGSRVTWE